MFKLTSSAFKDNQLIPARYSGTGEDLSPSLSWEGVPAGTAELVLLCDDPDAPVPGGWVHWVIYGLAPTLKGLPEGISRVAEPPEVKGVHGINSWPSDNFGYKGPMPPPGHGVHHYYFILFAVDRSLGLAPGADKARVMSAIEGHVLEKTQLTGLFER